MPEDYSKEVKELIKKYKDKGIIFGKDIDFFIKRIKISKKDIEEEVKDYSTAKFAKYKNKTMLGYCECFFSAITRRSNSPYFNMARSPHLRFAQEKTLSLRHLF